MAGPPAGGGVWPTALQRLLLGAALWDDDRAARAWRRARPSLDLDVLEPGSLVALPLVYGRLVALGVDDPDLSRLKGLWRRAWYENQLLAEQLARLEEALEHAGVTALLLGGLSVVARFYRGQELRRVAGLDVLVRPEAAAGATEALRAAGLAEQPRRRGEDAPRAFVGPRGHVCHLRSRPPSDLLVPGSEQPEEWWRAAATFEIRTMRCLGLSATDELLCACLRGAEPAAARPLDWILDAAAIVRTAGDEVDWGRLVRGAASRRLTLRLREALLYLARELDMAIPEQTLVALERAPVGRPERIAHRLAARRPGRALGGLPDTLATHVRLSADAGLAGAVRTLPAFLQRTWGLEHAWHVPFRAAQKLLVALARAAPRVGIPRRTARSS